MMGPHSTPCPGARSGALKVKFLLPALTEATDRYWRPIKYSLFPPLGLATLAAYLSRDDHAVIVDEHVEPLTLEDTPDLVIIQVYITNAYRAYWIADHYRSQGAFVCLGGLHVTSLPDEAAPHCDAIFLGPGEQTFPKFLLDFRAGTPQRVYASTSGRSLERIPPIRRDLIRRDYYLVPNSLTACGAIGHFPGFFPADGNEMTFMPRSVGGAKVEVVCVLVPEKVDEALTHA